ncbi:MAG: hypothetical protein JXB05_36185 [Myxococcaceae bacterium]|nr:hypothetical protein [Myxococcaceae bacterium]
MPEQHFVILVGGPGLYNGSDPDHDKAWYNYIDPVMSAAKSRLLSRPEEHVHWYVYGTAYERRWKDDATEPSFFEKNIKDGRLQVTRYGHTRKVIAQGAIDYLDYIRKKVASYAKPGSSKMTVYTHWWTGSPRLSPAEGFWSALGKFPDRSISRVWFLGHAARDLWLALEHDSDDDAVSPTVGEIVSLPDITRYRALVSKFVFANAAMVAVQDSCKFYGCNTKGFAETWARTFKVRAEGADGKVNFNKSSLKDVEASAQYGWKKFQP